VPSHARGACQNRFVLHVHEKDTSGGQVISLYAAKPPAVVQLTAVAAVTCSDRHVMLRYYHD